MNDNIPMRFKREVNRAFIEVQKHRNAEFYKNGQMRNKPIMLGIFNIDQ
jgi:hypothetical protein